MLYSQHHEESRKQPQLLHVAWCSGTRKLKLSLGVFTVAVRCNPTACMSNAADARVGLGICWRQSFYCVLALKRRTAQRFRHSTL